jgi:hypothetical protein
LFTLGTTAIAALSTVSAGMVSITSTSFVALTGNASTATALQQVEQFLEQVKLRLLQVLLMEQETFQAL